LKAHRRGNCGKIHKSYYSQSTISKRRKERDISRDGKLSEALKDDIRRNENILRIINDTKSACGLDYYVKKE